MSIVWPPELPQEQFGEISVKPRRGFIETEMDVGPPKRRRRTQVSRVPTKLQMELRGSQLALFEEFYNETLAGGTLGFEWQSVVSDATKLFFFLDEPEWDLWIANSDPDERIWRSTFSLEARES